MESPASFLRRRTLNLAMKRTRPTPSITSLCRLISAAQVTWTWPRGYLLVEGYSVEWRELPNWISALASVATATGLVLAYVQIRIGREIAQMQFEDAMSREYRELSSRLPTKAVLNEKLSDEEHDKALDEFIHYFDLSNEQIFLRQQGRVGKETWKNWCDGIQSNLNRPAFCRAWREVKARSNNFAELRRLEREGFSVDPADWHLERAPSGQ